MNVTLQTYNLQSFFFLSFLFQANSLKLILIVLTGATMFSACGPTGKKKSEHPKTTKPQ